MITPSGCYMQKSLHLSLKVASVIVQRKLEEALGDLNGVFNIVNYVIVGCGT